MANNIATRYVEDVLKDDAPERLAAEAIRLAAGRLAGGRCAGAWRLSVSRSVLMLAGLALLVGAVVALLALGLLDLIGLITHLAYTGTLATEHRTSRRCTCWAAWSVLVPMAGGLVVGVMARVGSERIRGHGIPEAMETILLARQSHGTEGSPCSSRSPAP